MSRLIDSRRENSHKRGYTNKWRDARAQYLREHSLCVHCMRNNFITPATEVDHIVPHKGDMNLFWDRKNWQPLCKTCHSAKTVREDGGFGRKIGKKEGAG